MSDEERMLDALAAAMRNADRIPRHAEEMAKAVPEIASLDAELAELTGLTAATRSAEASEDLIFEVDDLTVIVTSAGHDGYLVDVVGAEEPSAIALVGGDGQRHTAVADGLQYRIPPQLRGPIRVLIESAGRGPVVTDWFTLV